MWINKLIIAVVMLVRPALFSDAGEDITVRMKPPQEIVAHLRGRCTTGAQHLWAVIGDPGAKIIDERALDTWTKLPGPGEYAFTLIVSDGKAIVTSIVKVRVY
jgi:hypothetical protein